MDLNAYLLDGVVEATTPPTETEAAARNRRAAIVEMFRAFEPANALQAMIACQCVTLQFLLIGAMRDANNTSREPALLARSRAAATSISRTLHQWVSKLEAHKKRDATRPEEAVQVSEVRVKSAVQSSPPRQPNPTPADKPLIHAPPLTGLPGSPVVLPVDVMTKEGLISIPNLGRVHAAERRMTA